MWILNQWRTRLKFEALWKHKLKHKRFAIKTWCWSSWGCWVFMGREYNSQNPKESAEIPQKSRNRFCKKTSRYCAYQSTDGKHQSTDELNVIYDFQLISRLMIISVDWRSRQSTGQLTETVQRAKWWFQVLSSVDTSVDWLHQSTG